MQSTSATTQYQLLITIESDLILLESLLENVNSMEDRARSELQHFAAELRKG